MKLTDKSLIMFLLFAKGTQPFTLSCFVLPLWVNLKGKKYQMFPAFRSDYEHECTIYQIHTSGHQIQEHGATTLLTQSLQKWLILVIMFIAFRSCCSELLLCQEFPYAHTIVFLLWKSAWSLLHTKTIILLISTVIRCVTKNLISLIGWRSSVMHLEGLWTNYMDVCFK